MTPWQLYVPSQVTRVKQSQKDSDRSYGIRLVNSIPWSVTLSQCTVRDQCCICVIAKILILLYLFCSSHCGIPDTSISYHAEETDSILRLNYQAPADSRVKCILGCGEEESVHFIKTFDSLRKEILALNDLPLTINSIQGTDPAFRMTEVMSSFGWTNYFFCLGSVVIIYLMICLTVSFIWSDYHLVTYMHLSP